jgi:DNA-binding response OmpR family regulator
MERGDRCSGRVLVVDDEPPVGKVLHDWLERRGYRVRQAHDFSELQAALAEEEFDLVTLDIMMPEVDGLEALRWLRERHPDLGIIMATGVGDLGAVIEAMRLGALSYILKPFNMGLITAEIGRGMERQRLIAENRSYQRDLELKVAERTAQLREAHDRVERQLRELQGRDRLVRFQMAVHTVAEASGEVLAVIRETLGLARAVLYRPDPGGIRLEPAAAIGMGAADQTVEPAALSRVPVLELQAGGPQIEAFVSGRTTRVGERAIAVPVIYRDAVLGVLWTDALPPGEAGSEATAVLERLSGEAALALRGALIAEELEQGMSLGDPVFAESPEAGTASAGK